MQAYHGLVWLVTPSSVKTKDRHLKLSKLHSVHGNRFMFNPCNMEVFILISCILSKYLSCRDRDVIHRSNWKFQNERIMYLHQLKVTQRNKLSSLMTSSPFAITILFSLLCHSLGLREHLIWKVFEIWCWQNTSASHDHTGIRPFYKFMTS